MYLCDVHIALCRSYKIVIYYVTRCYCGVWLVGHFSAVNAGYVSLLTPIFEDHWIRFFTGQMLFMMPNQQCE